jgi:hypothetical protein
VQEPFNKIGEPTAVLVRADLFDKVGLFNENRQQSIRCYIGEFAARCDSDNYGETVFGVDAKFSLKIAQRHVLHVTAGCSRATFGYYLSLK